MQSRTLRNALQLFFLLLLTNAAVNFATKAQFHHCAFDEIHRSGTSDLPTVQPSAGELSMSKVRHFQNYEKERPHRYMRITFSAGDLNNETQYCKSQGSTVTDIIYGKQQTCYELDVLTETKKAHLLQIVRAAINMHTQRLKVKPLLYPIKVPEMEGPFCNLFTVPSDHRTQGVNNADMVLYVSSFRSTWGAVFAAGAPCAKIGNGRPVVGALTYITRKIALTEYSVRVAAHEIAHALGFTHKIIKKQIGDKLKWISVRGKSAEAVHSFRVMLFPVKQYNCKSSMAVELEDEHGLFSVPSHSHWKRRNALEELMAPIVTTGYYTYLTLAMFSDLKFYMADFHRAESMDWGKEAGCEYVSEACVGSGYVSNSRYFCNEQFKKRLYCAPGLRSMAKCSAFVHDNNMPYHTQYYSQFNWKGFYYDYWAGEKFQMTDRCPIYEPYSDLSCTDTQHSWAPGYKGPNAWCLRQKEDYTFSGQYVSGGVCAEVKLEGNGVVSVQTSSGSGFVKCHKNGHFYTAKLNINGKTHNYECPSKELIEQEKQVKNLIAEANSSSSTEDEQTDMMRP